MASNGQRNISDFFKSSVQRQASKRPADSVSPTKEKGEQGHTTQTVKSLRVSVASSESSSVESSPVKNGSSPIADTIQKKIAKEFKPNMNDFDPTVHASWVKNEGVPFDALSTTLKLIESTSKRLEIIRLLTNYFRSVLQLTPSDMVPSIYFCLNKVAPDYDGIEIGVGEGLLTKSIAEVTGRNIGFIKAELKIKGDLGLLAESCKARQSLLFAPKPLLMRDVFNKLKSIAMSTGKDSMQEKRSIIHSILVACRNSEPRFFIRSLSGSLRIGLAEQSVLVAIAHAFTFHRRVTKHGKPDKDELEENVNAIKTAYTECPDFEKVINSLLKSGGDFDQLVKECSLVPGVPIKPMLAHPSKSVEEVLKRFENEKFVCEYKYDGERAQIHMLEDGQIRIFSRNSEDNTGKYPDIISVIKNSLKSDVKSIVLDSEVVAYDTDKLKILPFQVLSRRKRKNVEESDIAVNVCVFAFDLLYLNGESMVKRNMGERRTKLRECFNVLTGQLEFAESMILDYDFDSMQVFLDKSVEDGCEGLMVKLMSADSTYEVSKRSRSWLKLKKDYLNNMGDTLDLLVMGAYQGAGKRTGTFGGFLLGCYDPDNDEYQSICKIGTGFKDDDLSSLTTDMQQHTSTGMPFAYRIDPSLTPDVWFEPKKVWEVKCADLSISPLHFAAIGQVDSEKGISLRFPRFIRVRTDKLPEDSTSASQVADMYRAQSTACVAGPENCDKLNSETDRNREDVSDDDELSDCT